jgi:FtsP/CotA-like multicopper oxidase with cupredoxin domain
MKKILCLALLLSFGIFCSPALAVTLVPGADGFLIPDYFGNVPNYANSPLPRLDAAGNPIAGTGMRKFVDGLPGLGPTAANNLGQYIPVAQKILNPNGTEPYPGCDYYEIGLVEYSKQMHSDLPATKLRGYVDLNPASFVGGAPNPQYLGPVIVAQRDRPVRVKFTNMLPFGPADATGRRPGDLFIPTDTSYMGVGYVPSGTGYSATETYTQNRAAIHLHGATTPWISDGTLFQWTTPEGETTSYPNGVSVYNVPDMPDAGDYLTAPPGTLTFYYTNQQSARLMFYHDHAAGITRLNVYVGSAAGYLLTDPNTTRDPVTPIYGEGIPLVIQDKTFVPDNTIPFTNFYGTFPSQLAAQDPTWDTAKWGGFGQLWYPHVYMTNQNPYTLAGTNAVGRWDYGPWFWPPFVGIVHGPVANPYYDPVNAPWEPPFIPGVPSVSGTPEAFMDTAVVNGTAFPTVSVPAGPVRLRILSVGNDRSLNLSLWLASPIVSSITVTNPGSGYTAAPLVTIANAPGDTTGRGADALATVDTLVGSPTFGQVTGITLRCVGSGYTLAPVVTIAAPPVGGTQATASAAIYTNPTEVGMVPFNSTQNAISPFPAWWATSPSPWTFDDRAGGVPDPATRGPAMIQIATEGGWLPAPAVIKNQPVNYVYNRKDITVGNVLEKALFLAPAERADVIVDFTNFAGKTLILYNDAPAATPAGDPRLDYYTCDLDQTDVGGAPSTLPGYGPNTRTVMQIVVGGSGGTAPVDDVNPAILSSLQAALPGAFAASQDSILVPQAAYNQVYGTATVDTPGVNLARIQDTATSFAPIGQTVPVLFDFHPKSIIEDFQLDFGRMNALLGVEIPRTNNINQTSIIQSLQDPPNEVVKISDPTLTPIGSLADGTQIWKITHNGVDTHGIHFHMFTVQVINRVGWDGAIRPPDANELGFKDTVRMNPLEDIIVALRPIQLVNMPFKIPNSVRPLAPDAPLGATLGPNGGGLFNNVDPLGLPVTITNDVMNFGWEYVWHCHILGHEENDMMHAMALTVAPDAPSGLGAVSSIAPLKVDLTWMDNSANETDWTVQRSNDGGVTFANLATVKSTTGDTFGTPVAYSDTSVATGTPYTYRVIASNTVGYGVPNYPQMTADSAFSNIAGVGAIGDALTISSVVYNAVAKTLTVMATSTMQPTAQLSATGFGSLGWKSWLNFYRTTFTNVAARPASVTVTSSLGGTATFNLPLADVVTISSVTYNATNHTLQVVATSSAQPTAQLSAVGFGSLGWKSWLNFYRTTFDGVATKPANVTVNSSNGGTATVAVP